MKRENLEISLRFFTGNKHVKKYIPEMSIDTVMQDVQVIAEDIMPGRIDKLEITVFLGYDCLAVQAYSVDYHDRKAHNLYLGNKKFTVQQVEELRKQQGEEK